MTGVPVGAAIAAVSGMAYTTTTRGSVMDGGRGIFAGTLALMALMAGGAGCGDPAGPKLPPSGAGGDGAAGGGAGGAPAQLGAPVWTDGSQSVEVSCSGYYSGNMRFAAPRTQLSAEQLALLGTLRTVGMSASCSVDGMSCQLTVTQSDGSADTFDAEEDGWCLPSSQDHVSFTALKPFLDTLACPFIRANLHLVNAVPLDAGCFDAVASDGQGSSFQLSVTDVSSPVRVELDDCDDPASIGQLSFTLFDTDGTTVLGTSLEPAESGPHHTCALLSAVVPHAGLLTITVAGTVPPGVAPALRVYQ